MVNNQNIFFQFSQGQANIGSNISVTEKTTFQTFSVTKTFSSLAILQLVDKRLLKLEDMLIKFLPENPYNRNITIKQLLDYSSGIPNPSPLKWVHPIDEDFEYRKFVTTVSKENPKQKSNPGHKMNYSNVEFLLLGEIIEIVSGMEYRKYIKKIF